MIQLIDDMLEGVCVYWANTGTTEGGGDTVYDDPVEIPCRWEDTNELYVAPGKNQQEASKAVVYVDRDLTLNGILTNCMLSQLIDLEDPMKNPNSFPINAIVKIPTLEYDQYLRKAML